MKGQDIAIAVAGDISLRSLGREGLVLRPGLRQAIEGLVERCALGPGLVTA
jgi:hypothetical protein